MIHQHIHFYEVTLYWRQLLHLWSKMTRTVSLMIILGKLKFSSWLGVFSFNIFLKNYNENICVLLSLQIGAKLENFIFCYIQYNNITLNCFSCHLNILDDVWQAWHQCEKYDVDVITLHSCVTTFRGQLKKVACTGICINRDRINAEILYFYANKIRMCPRMQDFDLKMSLHLFWIVSRFGCLSDI